MSQLIGSATSIVDSSNSSRLYEVLKSCANLQSYDSLHIADHHSDIWQGRSHSSSVSPSPCPSISPSAIYMLESYKMISSSSSHSTSGHTSCSSFASGDFFDENILEDDGRISLAYENLRKIPCRIAERFASQTKFLDLSYNNFQDLSILSYFEDLHTLILDRNTQLDVNTLPYLPSLRILWINNCDISNITDWIHRIRTQCPALEQLSLMGNPGIRNVPDGFFNTTNTLLDPIMQIYSSGNYRDYIFDVLPHLEYLDGSPRSMRHSDGGGSTVMSHGKLSSGFDISPETGNSASDCGRACSCSRKSSPTLSFKDLFGLKRRKKSYHHSSSITN